MNLRNNITIMESTDRSMEVQDCSTQLLELCVKGDSNAWIEFVQRVQPKIAAVIANTIRRWQVPEATLVDDLVQETYLKLCLDDFRALRAFDCGHENALYGFLKVVALNVVYDHFRSRCCKKRSSGTEDLNLEENSLMINSCNNAAQRIEQDILMNEISQFLIQTDLCSKRDFKIFYLYFREGYTAKAISHLPHMDLTMKGVESALLRMTRLLKNTFAHHVPEAEFVG